MQKDFALFCGPGTAASSEIKTHLFILLCNQCPNHNFWCSPCASCHPSWFHGWPFTAWSTVQLSWAESDTQKPFLQPEHHIQPPEQSWDHSPTQGHAYSFSLWHRLFELFFFSAITLSGKYKYTSLEEILIWHTAAGNMVTEPPLLPCHFHSCTTAPLG